MHSLALIYLKAVPQYHVPALQLLLARCHLILTVPRSRVVSSPLFTGAASGACAEPTRVKGGSCRKTALPCLWPVASLLQRLLSGHLGSVGVVLPSRTFQNPVSPAAACSSFASNLFLWEEDMHFKSAEHRYQATAGLHQPSVWERRVWKLGFQTRGCRALSAPLPCVLTAAGRDQSILGMEGTTEVVTVPAVCSRTIPPSSIDLLPEATVLRDWEQLASKFLASSLRPAEPASHLLSPLSDGSLCL